MIRFEKLHTVQSFFLQK